MTVQQASSQQLLFPLNFFIRQAKWKLSLSCNNVKNTGFVFEDNNSDHVVISGIPVNITR
jgi:DNA mismatch repair protein MutL